MGRAPCCDKANVKKGPWSPEEDAKLKSYIEQHGTGGNWIALPQKMGLKRCGKSCRLRWLNYLRPNIRHGGFSEEEDNIICSLYVSIGSRWSVIAAQLPGRTDNDIKNYWNTRLKKKLLGKHRKEQEARKQKQQEAVFKETSAAINPLTMMVVENSSSQQQPYYCNWPQMPVLAYSNQEPCFNDQDSIRSLLIKLGGRFSDSDHHHDHHLYRPSLDALNNVILPVADHQLIPQVAPQQTYEASCSSCCISSSNNNNGINITTIDDNNQVEMGDEMTGVVLGGVEELLYGEEEDMMVNIQKMIGPAAPACTQTTTTNWCDSTTTTTSLIYPPLPPSNHTRTILHQQCAFQDHLSYHGA